MVLSFQVNQSGDAQASSLYLTLRPCFPYMLIVESLLEKDTSVPVTGRLSAGPCGRH